MKLKYIYKKIFFPRKFQIITNNKFFSKKKKKKMIFWSIAPYRKAGLRLKMKQAKVRFLLANCISCKI